MGKWTWRQGARFFANHNRLFFSFPAASSCTFFLLIFSLRSKAYKPSTILLSFIALLSPFDLLSFTILVFGQAGKRSPFLPAGPCSRNRETLTRIFSSGTFIFVDIGYVFKTLLRVFPPFLLLSSSWTLRKKKYLRFVYA